MQLPPSYLRGFHSLRVPLAVIVAVACSPGVPPPPEAPQLPTGAPPPSFADYPADGEAFFGEPAEPDFATLPGARLFRTAIIRGATEGPNLARRFTVVSWGCGSQCHQFVILDAASGRITEGFTTMWGVEHRLESELLIVNPRPDDISAGVAARQRTRYYRWSGERLELLGER